MSEEGWVWIDGGVVPVEAARVPVTDRGFLYGDSVFEVTRTVGGEPLLLTAHLTRLAASAAGLAFAVPPLPLIRQAVAATLSASRAADCYLRIMVSRGGGRLDPDPAAAGEPRLVVIAKPLRLPDPELYRHGAAVVGVPQRRSGQGQLDPAIKSGSYLTSVLALHSARQRGAHEALLSDGDGHICEGATSNFFIVASGRLITPPLGLGMLAGITRQCVLELAAAAGVATDQRGFAIAEAAAASEAFLTSSIRGVLPVRSIDGQLVGDGQPGPLCRRLMQDYAARYLDRRSSASPSSSSSSSSPT